MIRLRPFFGRPVPGGHSFQIPGGPLVKSDKELDTEAIQELVDKITEYRVCNGKPIGDPLVEITAYYAIHYPFSIEQGERQDAAAPDRLTERVYRWINHLWNHPPKEFAEPDEVSRRQKICAGCRWRTDCRKDESKSAQEAQRRLFLLAKGSLGPDQDGWCKWHCHDNRLACLLPVENLSTDDPIPECWLRKP